MRVSAGTLTGTDRKKSGNAENHSLGFMGLSAGTLTGTDDFLSVPVSLQN